MKPITGHVFKRGPSWYVQWTAAGARHLTRLVDAAGASPEGIAAARKLADEVLKPYRMGDAAALVAALAAKAETAKQAAEAAGANPALYLAEVWTAFMDAPDRKQASAGTVEVYRQQWEAFREWMKKTYPKLKALADVTPEIAGRYIASLTARGLSDSTVNRHRTLLLYACRILKDKARLTGNPFKTVARRNAIQTSRREFTQDEVARLIATAAGELRTLLALGAYTGLRLGDCATLRWGEVDLSTGFIFRVPRKTARRHPTPLQIPIYRELRPILEGTPPADRTGHVLPGIAALYLRDPVALAARLRKHFEVCGIATHAAGTGTEKTVNEKGEAVEVDTGKRAVVEAGFHSLRHTFVSLCAANGVPQAVCEAMVGHHSKAVHDRYVHVGRAALSAAVNALPDMLTAKPTAPALPAPDAWRAELKRIADAAPSLKTAREQIAKLTA